jgi:hypothetical protein
MGELLLKGRAHAPIVSAVKIVEHGMGAPGETNYELLEAPQIVPGGCLRQRWTARFQVANDAAEAASRLVQIFPRVEVALPLRGCMPPQYAILNGGLDSSQALVLLRELHAIAIGTIPAIITCGSQTDLAPCGGPQETRAALDSKPAWAVSASSGMAEFWLGRPGSKVATIVSFPIEHPDQVSVLHKVPAPF